MAKDCFIEKNAGVVDNDNLRRFNSLRVLLTNGTSASGRYGSYSVNQSTSMEEYSNKEIFNFNGQPSKYYKGNLNTGETYSLFTHNGASGTVFIDFCPLSRINRFSKDEATTTFIDIEMFRYSNISELILPYNQYIQRDINNIGYIENLTSFISSRSKYSGSVESVVEKTIENYPTKEKSLLINLYLQADFGGTVTFNNSLLTVALYIEFNGDGTANVYNNTDHSTVIASYNGTTWTYA